MPSGGDNCDMYSTSTGAEVRELEDLSETPSEYRELREFSDSDTELRGSVLSGTGVVDDKTFIYILRPIIMNLVLFSPIDSPVQS